MKTRSLLVKPLLLAALTTGTVALIAACGGGSDSSNSTTTLSASSYAGPGSRWDVALAADSTFNITKRESASTPVVMTLTGSYQTLPSGFLKLSVGSGRASIEPYFVQIIAFIKSLQYCFGSIIFKVLFDHKDPVQL